MRLTDSQLLNQISTRDPEAFAAFFDRHAPMTLALIRRILPDPASSEDVLQEVFWQVWEQAGRYDSERSSPRTWLFLLARSRALDYRRRNPVRVSPPMTGSAEPAVGWDPLGGLERDEARAGLLLALLDIPADQAEVLELAFFEGLSHSRIAERLGLALGTVKTRIRAGLGRLRSRLSSDPDLYP
jgi:RNA polymerase sigma-70 factor (ECF subfamily)